MALDEMVTGLSALMDVNAIKEMAVGRARQLLKTDAAGLALLRETTGEIRWELLAGATNDRFRSIRLQMGECIAGRVIQSGEPAIIEDVDPELGSTAGESPGWLAVPALGIIGLGLLLWFVGCFTYLNGMMDSDPTEPDPH